MTGLIFKDFLVMRKTLTYYLFFAAVYVVLVAVGVFDISILPALVVVFAMMLPMSSMGYDDQAHWGAYAAATPAGRGGVVTAKYLFALLCILLSGAMVALLAGVIVLLGLGQLGPLELVFTLLGCMAVGLVMDAIILPLLLKFGSEKSRAISMAIFVAIFGGVALLGGMKDSITLTPPAWLLSAMPALLALVSIGGFVISYFIARGIYERKEL